MHAYVIRFYKITIKQKDVKPCIWKMNKDLRWIIKNYAWNTNDYTCMIQNEMRFKVIE